MFTKGFVRDPGNARRSGVKGTVEQPMARRSPGSKDLVNTLVAEPNGIRHAATAGQNGG
jgi:hypothetical protein